MSKFDKQAQSLPSGSQGPISTSQIVSALGTPQPETTTHEGGEGWLFETKSALFVTAVSNMVTEDTFYEKGSKKDQRFVELIRQVTLVDPAWVGRFARWLRNEANMRSASIVVAAEYAYQRLQVTPDTGWVDRIKEKHGADYVIPTPRSVVSSVLRRADEPGEMLAYWHAHHGRSVPISVKRGIGDAITGADGRDTPLYTERSLLKHDGLSKGYRFGDVIEIVHPRPLMWNDPTARLFKYAIGRRHNRAVLDETGLQTIQQYNTLQGMAVSERRAFVTNNMTVAEDLRAAGMSWEDVAGWIQGPMDAAVWESIIPSMGYMALLRNLGNFDQAGINDSMVKYVKSKLADPTEVEHSRQFPYRFLSAYKATGSVRWSDTLETALGHSLLNVPELPGRTLVLLDLSGSMMDSMSSKSQMLRYEVAGLFAMSLALRNLGRVDLFGYSSGGGRSGWNTTARSMGVGAPIRVQRGQSILRSVDALRQHSHFAGGTFTWTALKESYGGHDRIVIITDGQSHDNYSMVNLPNGVPIVTFDIAGYGVSNHPTGPGRLVIAGLTDIAYKIVNLADRFGKGDWPF